MDKSALPPLRLLGVIVPVCVAGFSVTCAAAVSFAVTPHPASTLLGLAALLIASTFADRFPVPVEGVDTGGVSLSFVFGVASIVLFGWAAGLLVVFLAPAVTQLLEQRPRIRVAYNVSVLALAATAAGALSAPLRDATGASGVLARVGDGHHHVVHAVRPVDRGRVARFLLRGRTGSRFDRRSRFDLRRRK